jgi:DNA polymerase IV
MPRKILHLDLDAFFCAVEEQRDPSLTGKPFAVGGRPEERGVVASCSYAARMYGVRSAMPMARALRLCPEMQVISSHHGAYSQVSSQVMERLHRISPLVEQISIDEAFVDVSDLSEPGATIAKRLQKSINDDLGLPCSIGIASNKLVAKIANDLGKASARSEKPPNAITDVAAGQEAAFLAPLPVERLWGVGPKTAEHLAKIGVTSIGDLARCSERELIDRFGKAGAYMYKHSRGIDDTPIITFHEPKSISQEITFAKDISDEQLLRRTLRELSENIGKNLRGNGYSGATIKLKLRWPDFTTLTRQTTLPSPTDKDNQISDASLLLFEKVWKPGNAVRLIGVGVSRLGSPARQLNLWDDSPHRPNEKNRQLQDALDEVRQRFGDQAIRHASDLTAAKEKSTSQQEIKASEKKPL